MLKFIADALIIPLEAYFTPRTFLARVTEHVPDNYTFFQALNGSPEIREKALDFISQLIAAMLIIPVGTAFIAWLLIPGANLPYMLIGALSSLVLGVVLGILPRALSYFKRGMAAAVGFGVVFGSVLSVLMGIYSSLAGSTDPTAIAATVDSAAGQAANAVLLGIVLGMCLRIFIGTIAKDVREAMLVGIIILVPIAIMLGLFSKPEVAMTNQVFGILAVLAFTGWFILPIEILISIVNRLVVAQNAKHAVQAWRTAPVRWDDFLILPTPDTFSILVALYDVDRDLYRRAYNRVQHHAFQARIAKQAQARIIGQ